MNTGLLKYVPDGYGKCEEPSRSFNRDHSSRSARENPALAIVCCSSHTSGVSHWPPKSAIEDARWGMPGLYQQNPVGLWTSVVVAAQTSRGVTTRSNVCARNGRRCCRSPSLACGGAIDTILASATRDNRSSVSSVPNVSRKGPIRSGRTSHSSKACLPCLLLRDLAIPDPAPGRT